MNTTSKKRLLNNIVIVTCIIMISIGFQLGRNLQPAPTRSLTTVNKLSIHHIQLIKNKQTILKLQKQGDTWQITHPLHAIAKPERVFEILSILELQSNKYYSSDALTLSEYGLGPAQSKLYFNEHDILLGDHDSVENNRYLLIKDTVFELSNSHFSFLNYSIGMFVDRNNMPGSP